MYSKKQVVIDDAVWNELQVYIPDEKPGGRPRDTDVREVINAIVYVLNNGCGWRKLPNSMLPWQTVYDYYRKWRKNGAWRMISYILVQNQYLDQSHLPNVYVAVS